MRSNGSIPGTPTPTPLAGGSFGVDAAPTNSVEEMLLRQRLGQEIPRDYSANSPKRTESLYVAPSRKKEQVRSPFLFFSFLFFSLLFLLFLKFVCWWRFLLLQKRD